MVTKVTKVSNTSACTSWTTIKKMYKQSQSLYFESSSSHLVRNLFTWNTSGSTHLGTIHNTKVQLMKLIKEEEAKDFSEEVSEITLSNRLSFIHQAKVITINNKSLLILITESNVQIHDLVNHAILYVYTIDGTEFSRIKEISPENFATGISFFNKTNSLLIGLINGSLMSFNLTGIDDNGVISSVIPTQSTNPISDVSTTDTMIGVGYSTGHCSVLEHKRRRSSSLGAILYHDTVATSDYHYNLLVSFDSFNGFPCSNICINCDHLIASFGSGHIRIYSITSKRLLSQVYGHKSWINSLHLVPCFDRGGAEGGAKDVSEIERKSQLLLSTSEDSFVKIWKINSYYPWIQLVFSKSIKNRLIVGGMFLNHSSSSFAVSCFDTNQVVLFEKN